MSEAVIVTALIVSALAHLAGIVYILRNRKR
jgi:hypothetical protein